MSTYQRETSSFAPLLNTTSLIQAHVRMQGSSMNPMSGNPPMPAPFAKKHVSKTGGFSRNLVATAAEKGSMTHYGYLVVRLGFFFFAFCGPPVCVYLHLLVCVHLQLLVCLHLHEQATVYHACMLAPIKCSTRACFACMRKSVCVKYAYSDDVGLFL